jgi:hypothetical protein
MISSNASSTGMNPVSNFFYRVAEPSSLISLLSDFIRSGGTFQLFRGCQIRLTVSQVMYFYVKAPSLVQILWFLNRTLVPGKNASYVRYSGATTHYLS